MTRFSLPLLAVVAFNAGCVAESARPAATRANASSTGVVAPQSSGDTSVTVLGTSLLLVDGTPCIVRARREAGNIDLRLSVSSPCALHRDRDGAIVTRVVNGTHVLLVERSERDATRPGSCDTRVQAIAVTPDAVRVSKAVERVAMCPPFQWDDVMFLALLKSVER